MENPFLLIEFQLSELSKKIDVFVEQMPMNSNNAPQRDIGNLKVATEETGLSSHSIYRLASQRKIPHFKRGGKLYFSRKALRQWIEEGDRKIRSL